MRADVRVLGCTALLLAAAAAAAAASSRVQLVDNGYRGVVIGIDDRVDVLDCEKILSNVQALINNASSLLYKSTNQRAFFHDVTVVVPSSWPRSCTGGLVPDQATTQSYLTSDLRVSGPHPVYGSAPWTRQAGLCGRPGDFVQFASDYITDDHPSDERARVLVHEWAKYRWGVFEEAGYAEDPLYPSFYRSTADQWTPTGCADAAVAGIITPPGCEPSSNECTFVPLTDTNSSDAEGNDSPRRSPVQAKMFCDSDSHDRAAPSKQNLLCKERSVKEVMLAHDDFRGGVNPPSIDLIPPPVDFRVVKAAPDRFFFVLESTATMRQQERWDFVSSSIRKFVNWDAPTGIQVGIGHFGSSYTTDRNLTSVPDLLMGRGELANLPPIADDVMEDHKSWRAAVDGALQALGSRAAGTTLIWVTGNQQNSRNRPSDADVDYMIARLQENRVRLVLVFYPNETPGLSRAATATGGDVIMVEDSWLGDQTSISVFHALADAYVHTLDKYISDKRKLMVRVEDQQFVGNGQQVRGRFLIDTTLGVNTTLTVLYNTRSEIGYVKLKPPGGELRPVYTYPDTTNHLQYIRIDPLQGEWEYVIDNLAPSHSSIVVQVMSSPSSSEDTARTEVWTSAGTGTLNATAAPLIIYASVMQGSAPVLNAQVTAVVTRPDGTEVSIQLLDNGLAVPDILHGDGIYSRYFTEFGALSEAGQLFTVRVEVGGTRARVVTGRESTPAACCGSTVGPVTSVPMFDLRRTASGGSLLVTGPAAEDQDVFPPNKVTDLRAEVNNDEQTIAFSWSAPGDDYDKPETRVSHYEVRFSESRDRLRDHFSECQTVSEWSQPEPAGTPSLAVIDFHTVNTMFYFAIRGVDEAGNAAELSNILPLVMPPPPITSTAPPPTSDTAAPVQPTPATFDNQLLLIVLLCVAGVMMVIILFALYYFLCYRRRKPDPGTGTKQQHITTVTVPPVESREPTPVKIAYDLEKEDHGRSLSSEGPTPVMWTASNILNTSEPPYTPSDSRTYGHYSTNLHLGSAASRARYNSYQTPYVEDMAYDGRSLVSTQPSDSYLSLASDPRHRNNNTLSEGGEPAGWPSDKDSLVTSQQQQQQQRGSRARAPPPTLPKPQLGDGSQRGGSRASIAGDRKRRNVTQV